MPVRERAPRPRPASPPPRRHRAPSTRSTTEPARDSPSIETFLTRDEQLGQHSLEGRAAAGGRCGEPRSAPSAVTSARAGARAAAWRSWPTSIRRPGSRCDRPRGGRRSRLRWPARRATIPASLSPRNQPTARSTRLRPPHVTGESLARGRTHRPAPPPRSAAGRSRGGLRRATSRPTGVTDRWSSRRLDVEEPAEQLQPVVEGARVAEVLAGGDECLGERGVGVRQAGFGPRPRVAAGRATDRPGPRRRAAPARPRRRV